MTKKPKGIIVRIMTKNKGLHQRVFPDLTIKDIEWFDAYEFEEGNPLEVKHSIFQIEDTDLFPKNNICRWETTGSCVLRYNGKEQCGQNGDVKCPLDKEKKQEESKKNG